MATNSKMFVYYGHTKAEFITAGYPTTYTNHIVFIKGDANGNGSCIYTHCMYFANFAELIAAMNYVKGVKVGSDTYNASAGGGYVTFESIDPSTLSLDVTNGKLQFGLTTEFVNKVNNTATNLGSKTDAADKDGSAFARIANLAALVSDLTGGSTDSIEGQITAAINSLRTEITGSLTDTTDAKTLEAINDELNDLDAKIKDIEDAGYITSADVNSTISNLSGSVTSSDDTKVKVTVTTGGGEVKSVSVDESTLTTTLSGKADLSNGKILTTQLPDYIFGQVMFGGTVVVTRSSLGVKPSSDFMEKFNKTTTTINITEGEANIYGGTYFIVSATSTNTFGNATELTVGDWIISTGASWEKVDNTDAVASVAGLVGVITAASLASKLSDSSVSGALATKTEVTNVKVTASGDSLVTASVDTSTGRVITVGATDTLITAVKNASSAYQKPTIGIPDSDLASDVQTSLTKANNAAPQSTTYTKTEVNNLLNEYYLKTEVDAMWEWEELE